MMSIWNTSFHFLSRIWSVETVPWRRVRLISRLKCGTRAELGDIVFLFQFEVGYLMICWMKENKMEFNLRLQQFLQICALNNTFVHVPGCYTPILMIIVFHSPIPGMDGMTQRYELEIICLDKSKSVIRFFWSNNNWIITNQLVCYRGLISNLFWSYTHERVICGSYSEYWKRTPETMISELEIGKLRSSGIYLNQ